MATSRQCLACGEIDVTAKLMCMVLLQTLAIGACLPMRQRTLLATLCTSALRLRAPRTSPSYWKRLARRSAQLPSSHAALQIIDLGGLHHAFYGIMCTAIG